MAPPQHDVLLAAQHAVAQGQPVRCAVTLAAPGCVLQCPLLTRPAASHHHHQTGAGKTFSMSGELRNYGHRGLVPRAIQHLYREIDRKVDRAFKVKVGAAEVVGGLGSMTCQAAPVLVTSLRQA